MIRPFRAAAVAALLLTTSAVPPAPPAPAPPPVSNDALVRLFSDEDYPKGALRRHEQGKVDFRLDIDSAGAVTGCTVTHSSGSASLDEATCGILTRRARFSPARDSTGNAVPDKFDGHIIWRIDDSAPSPEFDAAAEAWMRCLSEAVRQRAAGPEAAETIAAKAFDACAAEEARLVAVSAGPQGQPPPADGTSMRQDMRETLLQWIAEARAKPGR